MNIELIESVKSNIPNLLVNESKSSLNDFKCCECEKLIFKTKVFQCSKKLHLFCSCSKEKKHCTKCQGNILIKSNLESINTIESMFNNKLVFCPYSLQKIKVLTNEDKGTKKDNKSGCKKELKISAINVKNIHLLYILELEEHVQKCEHRFADCIHKQCKIKLRYKDLDYHLTYDCKFKTGMVAELSCKFKDQGCSFTAIQSKMEIHEKTNHEDILKSRIERLEDQLAESNKKSNEILDKFKFNTTDKFKDIKVFISDKWVQSRFHDEINKRFVQGHGNILTSAPFHIDSNQFVVAIKKENSEKDEYSFKLMRQNSNSKLNVKFSLTILNKDSKKNLSFDSNITLDIGSEGSGPTFGGINKSNKFITDDDTLSIEYSITVYK